MYIYKTSCDKMSSGIKIAIADNDGVVLVLTSLPLMASGAGPPNDMTSSKVGNFFAGVEGGSSGSGTDCGVVVVSAT